MTITDDARDEARSFRADREGYVRGPRGPIAFVWGDHITRPGQKVADAPGLWSPAPKGVAGIVVTATADEGVVIGGTTVDGQATLFHETADGPHLAAFPDGSEGVVFTYDDSRYALQVWNPQSEWAKRFDRIEAFDWDEGWAVEAEIRPVEDGRTVAITHHRDPTPVEVRVAAELRFTIDGGEHRLLATRFGDSYLVHFRDATNGVSSYHAGRSILVPDTGGSAVTLDFNRATLLPCSFSLAWNCPLPPVENSLPFEVTAGERNAVDAAGVQLL